MARRYSDIERGPLLAQAFQKRQAYRTRDIESRNSNSQVGTRASSPGLFILVKPFSHTLVGESDSYRVRTNQRNRQQLRDEVGNRALDLGTDTTYQINGNFTPAKVKLFVKASSSPATSKVTGIRYLKANGQNYSHPFGPGTATEKVQEAFNTIANALRNASPNNRVTYSPEKLSEER